MPLPDNLLSPIPGANPSGENLRYAPILDKIKEARREEDDAAQGEWQREIKKADYALVIKLGVEALQTKSKDLQVAAWLVEALLRRESFTGLREGLNLLRGLLETFWDTLYPELEEGDAELRATPLEWVGGRLDEPVKWAPLTKSGLGWFQYTQSRAVGYESDAAKKDAREAAIAEGKLTAEAFDEAFDATPKAFYQQLVQDLDQTLESLQSLDELCGQKFGSAAPSYSNLRAALEEVKQTVRILLKKKLEKEPDATSEVEEAAAGEEAPPAEEEAGAGEAAATPQAAARRAGKPLSAEPADRDDAVRRIVGVARYLRREEPGSPVPYLMLRGLRWGELRANGSDVDSALLEAPSTELRQQLKRLAGDGQWQEVLESAEGAMAMPCGRAWLDVQRYLVRACEELGSSYDPVANAVRSELKALLTDFPQLPELMLSDDTPTANPETHGWLREHVVPPPPAPVEAPEEPLPVMEMDQREEAAPGSEPRPPDAYEIAADAARSGRLSDAIGIMTEAIAQERSGRARFQRKIQLAGICMAAGNESIAHPILEELWNEIERRKLDEWEAADVVAHPLTLLFRCLDKLDLDAAEKQKVYAQICRLDPVQALACMK